MKKRGFTLIELLVVIAIIGLLATMAVVGFGNAQKKARDARRLADITAIDKVLRIYYDETNSYPGWGYGGAVKINPDCTTSLFATDLAAAEYLAILPKDPRDNLACGTYGVGNYFYAWDMDHAGMEPCFSINVVETQWGKDRLVEKFGQLKSTVTGGDGSIDSADFNFCYHPEGFYP
jgi:prepilin-type N-terminal cleavage/methylation domain-containing protein